MPKFKRKYILLIAIMVVVGAGLTWLRSYVFEDMAVSLQERLQSLKVSGLNVRYDSMHVDWLRNAIEIHELLLEKNIYDTTCIHPEFIHAKRIRVEGIGLLSLLIRNTLSLDAVYLDTVRVVLREHSLFNLDSSTRKKNEFTLKADEVFLRGANIIYTDSAQCRTISGLKGNLTLTELELDSRSDSPLTYNASTVTLETIELELPQEYYNFTVQHARWNRDRKAIRVDSIRIIPQLGKTEFARRHSHEIDRFECQIPYFAASGISMSQEDSLDLNVQFAEIKFDLKVFRDKRLPFLPKRKYLPVEQMRNLAFGLTIDSLRVMDSFVQYEEIVEKTSEAAGIYFDKLNAVLKNFTNKSSEGNATLASRARLYGQGDLALNVVFPLDGKRASSAKGFVRNFHLPKLNAILTPSTQIGLESGEMNELAFSFTFNNLESNGQIALNYEKLKLVSYRDAEKANGNGQAKDNIKTFIMNAFVFRKNMTDDLPPEKRTGTIAFARDETRSIFNYWSKSLVSGLKSAYNLEKVEAKKEKAVAKKTDREIKKDERLARREARRQKRKDKRNN